MKNEEVENWFEKYEHPNKDAMLYVRDIILQTDERIKESIKWKSPTYSFMGNIASFNPRTKKHVSLMFHTGASILGNFSSLEGSGKVARYLKINSMEQANLLREEIENIVKAWILMKGEEK